MGVGPGSGKRRRVSDAAAGAEEALITADGEGIVWWHDPAGDERGRWMVTPFGGGEPRPLLPGLPDAWAAGISMVPGRIAAGFATDDAYVVVVATGDGPPEEVLRQPQPAGVGREWPQGGGGLSADRRLLCLRDAAEADIAHPALRVVDLASGATVATLLDAGRVVEPIAWSPLPGDARLLVTRETADRRRPWVWDVGAGTLTELRVDLPGDVADGCGIRMARRSCSITRRGRGRHSTGSTSPTARSRRWWRAAARSTTRACGRTARPGTGTTMARPRRRGSRPTVERGSPRPASRRPRVADGTGPAARTLRATRSTRGCSGQTENRRSRRSSMPTAAPSGGDRRADPLALAYADAGYAVLAPNYRGSTGYGAAFRERLRGDPGFPETSTSRVSDRLVGDGVADPGRIVLEGWSWGGYLATLGAGLHRGRWRAVVAGIPVGDLVAAH